MDNIDDARTAVAEAIAKLRAYTAPAGSEEMVQVMAALDYCGYAYSCLRPDNPAWADKAR